VGGRGGPVFEEDLGEIAARGQGQVERAPQIGGGEAGALLETESIRSGHGGVVHILSFANKYLNTERLSRQISELPSLMKSYDVKISRGAPPAIQAYQGDFMPS
jgi:hypothetical protein